MTFSNSGKLASNCHGSKVVLLTPNDSSVKTTPTAAKSQSRRSWRHTIMPPTATPSTPTPKYWGEKLAPEYPFTN